MSCRNKGRICNAAAKAQKTGKCVRCWDAPADTVNRFDFPLATIPTECRECYSRRLVRLIHEATQHLDEVGLTLADWKTQSGKVYGRAHSAEANHLDEAF